MNGSVRKKEPSMLPKVIFSFLNISSRTGYLMRSFSQSWSKGPDSVKKINSSVDSQEVFKFESHVKYWWDVNGPYKGLHQLNNVRVPFVQDGLNSLGILNPKFVNSSTPLKDLNILDVGCGGGILSEPLAQLGGSVTGVDASEKLIQVAKLHSLANKNLVKEISYIHAPLEDISDEYENYFDVVVASEIIEHVFCKETFLKSCTDVLKPGGSLFLTTFNKTIMSWLYGIIILEYVFQSLPKGTHEWEKFVPPQEAQAILNKFNCDTRLVRGLIDIGYKWTWIESTSVSYVLHAVKRS